MGGPRQVFLIDDGNDSVNRNFDEYVDKSIQKHSLLRSRILRPETTADEFRAIVSKDKPHTIWTEVAHRVWRWEEYSQRSES